MGLKSAVHDQERFQIKGYNGACYFVKKIWYTSTRKQFSFFKETRFSASLIQINLHSFNISLLFFIFDNFDNQLLVIKVIKTHIFAYLYVFGFQISQKIHTQLNKSHIISEANYLVLNFSKNRTNYFLTLPYLPTRAEVFCSFWKN